MSGNLLPKDPRSDDLYLVEFPKSGITWISFILANMLCRVNTRDIDVTYYNIQQIIPDLHMSRNVGQPVFSYPGYRILKSHSVFKRRYWHSIYVLRNPVDVMVSYYHFCCDHDQFDGTFESFLADDLLGVKAYNRHVTSWVGSNRGAHRLHLLKYEDLISNAPGTIEGLVKNLGWHAIDKEIIKDSIEKSSIDNMKTMEHVYRANDPCYNQVFVGRNQLKKVKEPVSEKQFDYIYTNAKLVCDRFYPDLRKNIIEK